MRLSQAAGALNPYRIADYDAVDSEFGAEADFIALVKRAHELEIRVMMDVVLYHAGPDFVHPEYLARDESDAPVLGKWNFPVLNYGSQKVRFAIREKMMYWAKQWNVDGFRCDVSSGVSLDFWAEAREQLNRINPEFLLLGDGTAEELEKVFDLGYNERYYETIRRIFSEGESASLLQEVEKSASTPTPETRRLRYSDMLDKKRACIAFSENGAGAAAVLNFTLGGVPFVYNGQEFGDGTPCEILAHQAIRWDTAHADSTTLQPPRLLTLHRQLYALHRTEAALHSATVRWISNSAPDDVVSYVKSAGNHPVLFVVNVSNRKRQVALEWSSADAELRNLLPGTSVIVTGRAGKLIVDLDAFGFFAVRANEP